MHSLGLWKVRVPNVPSAGRIIPFLLADSDVECSSDASARMQREKKHERAQPHHHSARGEMRAQLGHNSTVGSETLKRVILPSHRRLKWKPKLVPTLFRELQTTWSRRWRHGAVLPARESQGTDTHTVTHTHAPSHTRTHRQHTVWPRYLHDFPTEAKN